MYLHTKHLALKINFKGTISHLGCNFVQNIISRDDSKETVSIEKDTKLSLDLV